MNEDCQYRADTKRNEYLFQTEFAFNTKKSAWVKAFTDHFRVLCSRIHEMQVYSALSSISQLDYTMLYTSFINRQYISDIFAYNEKSYLDKNQCHLGSYNISIIFPYFDQLWNDLLNLRKRYIGQVSAREITLYMLETLPDFYSYLTSVARMAIAECVDKSPLTDIKKNETFTINVGDYMTKTEPVYVEKKTKNAEKIVERFNEQSGDKYTFGDYSFLDFSGHIFPYLDLRYSQFRSSSLRSTSLAGSSLIGVNFQRADMENCILDNCSLYEADFTEAKLRYASMKNIVAKTGLAKENEWKFVGFLPAVFRNADLIGANFYGANLAGADFSGAVLSGVNFRNANLDSADFTDANITDADFSDATMNNTIIHSSDALLSGKQKDLIIIK